MSSLQYRKERITMLEDSWNLRKVNDFFLEWEIPAALYSDLKRSICVYVSKALHFEYTENEELFMQRLDSRRQDRKNVTPNGGVAPKCEYAIEYNAFIRSWCDVVREMTKNEPSMLTKFRLTPNVRIKYGEELTDNIGRGLDTSLPHSDAWVEGHWGMNCHVPIIGDTQNNFLHFYKLKREDEFQDVFLDLSKSYTEMQWVTSFYEDDSYIPKTGHVNISDYVLLHKTLRKPNAKTRVSIDTTIFAGNHEVHPDRKIEYSDSIPRIGEDLFISCVESERENFSDKKSTFSHYTSGKLKHVSLRE